MEYASQILDGGCHRSQNEYNAVVKQEGGWWVGWIEEVPGVNCQERTRDALLDTLRITVQEALELYRDPAR